MLGIYFWTILECRWKIGLWPSCKFDLGQSCELRSGEGFCRRWFFCRVLQKVRKECRIELSTVQIIKPFWLFHGYWKPKLQISQLLLQLLEICSSFKRIFNQYLFLKLSSNQSNKMKLIPFQINLIPFYPKLSLFSYLLDSLVFAEFYQIDSYNQFPSY